MHCRKDKSGLFFHSSRPYYREHTVLYAKIVARGAVLRVNRPPHLGLTPGHPSPTLPYDLNLRAPPATRPRRLARPRKTQSTELSRADSNSIASRVGGFLIEWWNRAVGHLLWSGRGGFTFFPFSLPGSIVQYK